MMERICILMFKPLSIKWIRNSYSRDFQTELKDLIFKLFEKFASLIWNRILVTS